MNRFDAYRDSSANAPPAPFAKQLGRVRAMKVAILMTIKTWPCGWPIVDQAALIEALRARRIAGAALDMFEAEPLPADRPFRTLDNVLATPHIGYRHGRALSHLLRRCRRQHRRLA
jgi:D-isomer specific 2-hydroxyacid dehydrogenase, NAD binding domain